MDDILLHACCAPCGAPAMERLKEQYNYSPSVYFSNSNIYPCSEYEMRLNAVRQLTGVWGLPLLVAPYDHGLWLDYMRGYEKESEGGNRCERCFAYNLGEAARAARQLGMAKFTTSLTLSPLKSSPTIKLKGEQYKGFVFFDFKKQDGHLRSLYLCQKYNLYRQNYCGCEFSLAQTRRVANL